MDSEAVDAVRAEITKPPEPDFEGYAKSLGIPMDEIKAKVQKERAAEMGPPAPVLAPPPDQGIGLPVDQITRKVMKETGTPAEIPRAVGQGLAILTQHVVNTGLDVAHKIIDFGAKNGLAIPDLVTPDRIDWASKFESPNDSLTVRATRGITQYAAPVLATMGVGGGPMAAVAAGELVNFFTMDPHQQRLSSMLLENAPELKNFPAAYHAAEWLSNKPGETDMEGRARNAIEGLGVGAATARIFQGVLGFSSGLRKALTAAPEEVAAGAKAVAGGAPELGMNVPNLGGEVGQIRPTLNEHPLLQMENPVTVTERGPQLNLNNENVLQFAREYTEANPKNPEELFAPPSKRQDVIDQRDAIMRSPEELQKVLSWKRTDSPLSAPQVEVFKSLIAQSKDDIEQAAMRAVQTGAPEDLANMHRAIDTFDYIHETKTAAGTKSAQSLNAFKLAEDISGMSHQDFLNSLTEDSKRQLIQSVVDSNGGEKASMEVAHQIAAISEMGPDEVGRAMGKVLASKQGSGIKAGNILQSIAINGMLSRPSTVMGNMLSNLGTTVHSTVNNYAAVGIGKIRPHIDNVGELLADRIGLPYARSSPEALQMSDANEYVKGLIGAVGEGFDSVGKALKEGTGGVANTVKGDLIKPINSISADTLGIEHKVLGAIANKAGMAVGMPSRINATADAFFGTIMYRAKLRQLANMSAQSLGLDAESTAKFMEATLKDVPEVWHREAMDFAQTNTFSKALDPASIAGKVDSVLEKHPLVKVMTMPFFKTQANLVRYAFESSPLAYLSSPIRTQILRGGVEGDLAVAKVATGTAFLGMAAGLAAMGTITGPDTQNPRLKQALQESGIGFQPNSLRINGNYYSYDRVDPFASILKLGSVVAKLRNDVSQDEYQHLSAIAGGALVDFMSPEKIIEGFSNTMESYDEAVKTGLGPKFAQASADAVGRFMPFSGLQGDLKKYTDLYKRDQGITPNQGWLDQFTDRLINHYKANSPWFSQDLPVARNFLGEPQLVPDGLGPDLISPVAATRGGNTDLVDKLRSLSNYYGEKSPQDADLQDLQISLPGRMWGPPDSGTIKIPLTPAEHEKYIMYSAGLDPATGKGLNGGPTLRDILEKQIAGFRNISPNMTATQYNQIVGQIAGVLNGFRANGRALMMREPEVMARWQKALDLQNKDQKTINIFGGGQ